MSEIYPRPQSEKPELPSVPGATLYGDPLQRASFGGELVTHGKFSLEDAVHEVIVDPELIVRFDQVLYQDNTPETIEASEVELLESFTKNIQVARQLHSEFGLSIPNYITSLGQPRVTNPHSAKERQRYVKDGMTGMSRVHGVQFFKEHLGSRNEHNASQLDQIPERVTVTTINKLLNYYEAVIAGNVPRYVGDLRLGNMVYGRLQGDYQDDAYIIDIEDGRYVFDVAQVGLNPAFDTIVRYGDDLAAMSAAYGKAYQEIAERVLELSKNAPHMTDLETSGKASSTLLLERSRVQYYLDRCEHGEIPTYIFGS